MHGCFLGLLPFFMPELWDEFLVTLTESRLLISPDQSTAVKEELSERRAGEEREGKHNCWMENELIYLSRKDSSPVLDQM